MSLPGRRRKVMSRCLDRFMKNAIPSPSSLFQFAGTVVSEGGSAWQPRLRMLLFDFSWRLASKCIPAIVRAQSHSWKQRGPPGRCKTLRPVSGSTLSSFFSPLANLTWSRCSVNANSFSPSQSYSSNPFQPTGSHLKHVFHLRNTFVSFWKGTREEVCVTPGWKKGLHLEKI